MILQHEAVVLATADADGKALGADGAIARVRRSRIRLLHQLQSRKGNELAANPRAALCFVGVALQRQIRIEGSVERTNPAESDSCWRSRPRDAQLAAIVSDQSRAVASRRVLDEAFADLEANGPRTLTRPPDWGGSAFGPMPSSSGKAGSTACTIAFVTAATTRDGWSSGPLPRRPPQAQCT